MKKDQRCLLICEGVTNSVQILVRLLRDVFETVEIAEVQSLPGRSLEDWHLIFLRVCHPRWHWIVDYSVERGLSYDYLIDDNFYAISRHTDLQNGPLYDHPATRSTLTHYIANARKVVAFSRPFVAEIKKQVPSANVDYVPPGVDFTLFDRFCSPGRQRQDGVVRIGYATTPRAWLSSFITSVVAQTSSQLGERVEFDFVGWWPDALATHPRVRTFDGIQNYEAYVEFVAGRSWDIGIAPLGESLFENCKTNNKFREYAAARIPSIYSDVPLYRSCVEDSRTGWLEPNDPTCWSRRLAEVAENFDARRRVADAAYVAVKAEYAQATAARALASALKAAGPLS